MVLFFADEKVWIFIALLFGVLVWLNFHSRRPALRVLMYHKVDPVRSDFLTVTTEQLTRQLTYLQQKGYQFVALPEVLRALTNPTNSLPRRSVLITFDDAYENNLTVALPILRELAVPTTIFVPTGFIGKVNKWDGGTDALMTTEQLTNLPEQTVALGYHSHRHINFNQTPLADVRADLEASIAEAARLGLSLWPAFAYPYGARPKDPVRKQQVEKELERLGIKAAFRIGNRINPIPIRNPYELNRIDVRGTDSFAVFRRKVRWGKLV